MGLLMLNSKGKEGGRRGHCEQGPAIPCQSLASPTTHTSAA